MIVKEKILLEFGVPTISGLIYSDELVPNVVKKIINNDICGTIQYKSFSENDVINPICKIFNPKCLVDETDEEPHLIIACDILIDETKLSKEELEMINTKPWRLVALGTGDVDEKTNIVTNYDLRYVNIEMVNETDYNEKK